MKRNVLVFGLISGLIVVAMMLYSVDQCYKNEDFEGSKVLGYAAMIAAFSFIFIGVKNYRDKYNSGVISFGKALKIGVYITLIASTLYVLVWLVDYYLFVPDFIDKYTAHVLKTSKADGATQQELQNKASEMAGFAELYENPLFVILVTYSEIFPIGFLISLITALILKRRSGKSNVAVAS